MLLRLVISLNRVLLI